MSWTDWSDSTCSNTPNTPDLFGAPIKRRGIGAERLARLRIEINHVPAAIELELRAPRCIGLRQVIEHVAGHALRHDPLRARSPAAGRCTGAHAAQALSRRAHGLSRCAVAQGVQRRCRDVLSERRIDQACSPYSSTSNPTSRSTT